MPYKIEVLLCDLALRRGFLAREELDACLAPQSEAALIHELALAAAYITRSQIKRLNGEILRDLDTKHRVVPRIEVTCKACNQTQQICFHNAFDHFFCPECLGLISIRAGVDTAAAIKRKVLEEQDTSVLAVDENTHEREFEGIPDHWIDREVDGFRIISKIGVGGMGAVYRAEDAEGQPSAIKVIAEWLTSDEDSQKRFLREARLLAELAHPNIRQLYAVHELAGHYLMRMEFVRGESLESVLQRSGAFEPAQALHIIYHVCLGLEHAHQKRVLHRDIKPHNVLLGVDGTIKICDFGIAVSMETQTELTQTGQLIGTVGYMSPEQIEGQLLDGRSDIYSLGVTLFYLLTGQLPYRAENLPNLIIQMLTRPEPSPDDLAPELPDPICHVTRKMMRRRPEDRYPDISALRADLEAILEGRFEAATEGWISYRQFAECHRIQREAAERSGTHLPLEEILHQRGFADPARASPAPPCLPVVGRYSCSACGRRSSIEMAYERNFLCRCGGSLSFSEQVRLRRTGDHLLVDVLHGGLIKTVQGELLRDHLYWYAHLETRELAIFLGQAGPVPVAQAGWMIELARSNRDSCQLSVIFDDDRLLDHFNAIGFDQFVRVYNSSKYYMSRRIGSEAELELLGLQEPIRSSKEELFFLYEAKDFEGAIRVADALLEKKPERDRVYYFRGVCHYYLRRDDEARRDLQRALEISPDDVPVRFFLGQVYLRMGDYPESWREYTRVLEAQPDHLKALSRRGTAYFLAGETDLAEQDFSDALKLNPNYRRPLYGMGRIQMQLKQWTRSEDYLRRAIAVAPNHPEAYFRLACVCAMAERESEALACLEGAVARGFNKIGHLRDDPTLAGLQQNERMKALIHGLAACGQSAIRPSATLRS